MTKDLHVTLRVRNNALRSRRVALGLSGKELAERAGITAQQYSVLEGLRRSPVNQRAGGWGVHARKLAAFFKCDPVELFPLEVLDIVEPVVEFETDVLSLRALSKMSTDDDPQTLLERAELTEAVHEMVDGLPPRQRQVVSEYAGLSDDPRNFSEIARELGRSTSRIGMNYHSALRKMRSTPLGRRVRQLIVKG